MLTNGLVWLHLRRIETNNGMSCVHSAPISVVKKGLRKVDPTTIDIVVDNILYVLGTAKNLLQNIVQVLGSKQKLLVGSRYEDKVHKLLFLDISPYYIFILSHYQIHAYIHTLT